MKQRVQVEYVDVESGRTLGRASLPVERIPDPLELKPCLTLGEERFVVVGAEPRASRDVAARGQLRLTLRRVVGDLSTADLTFRRPTLCGALPPLAPAPAGSAAGAAGASVLRIERDGWRQHELIARAHAEAVAATLLEVRRVRARGEEPPSSQEEPAGEAADQAPREPSFRELVLRPALYPAPLPGICPEWLRERFREPQAWDAVTLRGLKACFAEAFGLRLRSGLSLYGLSPGGKVRVAALCGQGEGRHLYHDAAALAEVLEVHSLVLVDWCRARVIPSDELVEFLSDE
ncbi:MAG: hypothetical protein AB7N76_30420 [Planctomycetota bacterium]